MVNDNLHCGRSNEGDNNMYESAEPHHMHSFYNRRVSALNPHPYCVLVRVRAKANMPLTCVYNLASLGHIVSTMWSFINLTTLYLESTWLAVFKNTLTPCDHLTPHFLHKTNTSHCLDHYNSLHCPIPT